jgi:hypothetical protein
MIKFQQDAANRVYFSSFLLYMFRALHSPIIRISPALTRLQATSPTHTFRTADLDLAHTSPSYTNDLYSYTIPACTVEAPDDG